MCLQTTQANINKTEYININNNFKKKIIKTVHIEQHIHLNNIVI